jgi:hypothetical protein
VPLARTRIANSKRQLHLTEARSQANSRLPPNPLQVPKQVNRRINALPAPQFSTVRTVLPQALCHQHPGQTRRKHLSICFYHRDTYLHRILCVLSSFVKIAFQLGSTAPASRIATLTSNFCFQLPPSFPLSLFSTLFKKHSSLTPLLSSAPFHSSSLLGTLKLVSPAFATYEKGPGVPSASPRNRNYSSYSPWFLCARRLDEQDASPGICSSSHCLGGYWNHQVQNQIRKFHARIHDPPANIPGFRVCTCKP